MKRDNVQLEKRRTPGSGSVRTEISPLISVDSRYPRAGGYIEEDTIDIREAFLIILRRKWMILAITAICTLISIVAVLLMNPWYSSSSVLEITKPNSMVLNSASMTLNEDSDPYYLVTLNTSMLTLDSYELLEEVVNDLKLTENEKILDKLGIVRPDPSSVVGKEVLAENRVELENLDGIEKTIRLRPFTEYLKRHTSVAQVQNARALRLTYTDGDPVLAARIADGIARAFIRVRFEQQSGRFKDSANWLANSTEDLKNKVRDAESALADYSRANKLYGTDEIGESKLPTLIKSKLNQLNESLVEARSDRFLKQSLYVQVKKGRINELPEVYADPKLVPLQEGLAAAKSLAAETKVKFGPSHAKLIEANNQVDSYEKQIERNIRGIAKKVKADYERAIRDERALTNELNKVKAEALDEGQASIRFNLLKNELETQRTLYNDFLQKTSQANIKVAEQNSTIRILQKAQIPIKKDGPKRTLIVIATFLLSLGGGAALAFVLESLDDSVRSVDEIERLTGLGVVSRIDAGPTSPRLLFGREANSGAIENLDLGSNLELSDENGISNNSQTLNENSAMAESYSSLRTAILLSGKGQPPKTILVTSSLQNEGTTTIAINLAVSLSKLGLKTVLMDIDLRNPALHDRLGVDSTLGVTNYLSNTDHVADDLIQDFSISNLSVMTSGPIVANPADLLSSKRMNELLASLKEKFDCIIIDSAPLTDVVDSSILSTLVDGTLLVVKGGAPTKEILRNSSEQLYAMNANVLGLVLNIEK